MSSSDFTFISLRNITAYQPTGSWVPQNYVLNMSTNGAAAWTNSITLDTITGSTIIGDVILGYDITSDYITGYDVFGDYITGSTITGDIITGNSISGDTITMSTIVGNDITGTTIGCENIVCSTMVGEAIIGSTISVLSTLVVGPTLISSITGYNYTGSSTISSMLIVIGDDVWKIPVEFVSTLPHT